MKLVAPPGQAGSDMAVLGFGEELKDSEDPSIGHQEGRHGRCTLPRSHRGPRKAAAHTPGTGPLSLRSFPDSPLRLSQVHTEAHVLGQAGHPAMSSVTIVPFGRSPH